MMLNRQKKSEVPNHSLLLSQMYGKDLNLSAEEMGSDESCDFFSDNLSETAAGVLPADYKNMTSTSANDVGKKSYHLFVFVHGF